MVFVKKEGIILEPTNFEFENQGVLNPSIVQNGNTLHMFYRGVKQGNFSSIGYCRLEGPLKVVERFDRPVLAPEFNYEIHGTEDPRIVYIDGLYYMFYVAYDGTSAVGALAVSKDMKSWEKKGIITPNITYDVAEDYFKQSKLKLKEKYFFFESYYKDVVSQNVLLWEKDISLFPKKIKGRYALVHRILPDMQVIYFDNFEQLGSTEFWEDYLKKLSDFILLESKYWYESRNIGGGCPPIETKDGWLLIYHAVQDTNIGKVYRASAALLDKDDPTKVIGRLSEPLFSPEAVWELKGDVDNVVFPTGTAIFGNRLYIYYGAADKRIAAASLDLNELLDDLINRDKSKNIIAEIGFVAGKVYFSCKQSPKTITQLKNEIKRPEEIILLAIGWLMKENKIGYLNIKDEVRIRTKN
jgi:predicted GH43/DUF377 family glycosyl hydrolase